MLVFSNPAHRTRLQQLGVLQPGESQLTPETLAERVAISPAIGEVLYILRQDIVQPLTIYTMVDTLVEMTRDMALAIKDAASLEVATHQFIELAQLPIQGHTLAVDIDVFVQTLHDLWLVHPISQTTDIAQKEMDKLIAVTSDFLGLIAHNQLQFMKAITEIGAIIEEKKRQLGL